MSLVGRASLYTFSIGAHAVLGAYLGTIPPAKSHETVAISFTETHKVKPAAAKLPREPDPAPPSAPAQAKASPTPAAPAHAPEASAPAAPGLAALPDFGLALEGGGSGGLAVPVARPATSAEPASTSKTLARTAPSKADDCGDPPAKPKPLSRPTPAYTADALALGIAGKVRVEVSVDDQGRVVSVRVIEGLGHGLDESALAAARAMTFDPARRCGRPTTATFKIGFTFSPPPT